MSSLIVCYRSERESYGDSAVGFVQVKRDGNICVVKARITPEHNVRQKCYAVEAVCDEAEETILSVQCGDCAAHLGRFSFLSSAQFNQQLNLSEPRQGYEIRLGNHYLLKNYTIILLFQIMFMYRLELLKNFFLFCFRRM